MKTFRIILSTLLCGIVAVSCSLSDSSDENALPEGDYNTYWYYSYGVGRVLKAENFGLADREYDPYTVVNIGDTLMVANTGSGSVGSSILLYSLKNNRMMRKLDSWKFNGKAMNFGTDFIEAVVPAGDRLYVALRQSLIHVFTLPDLEYVTCIGNGNWNNAVFQAQAVMVTGGLIYTRSKDKGEIRIFREADATPANYQKIWAWKRAAGSGEHNNAFAAHSMVLNEEGNILLTAYEGKAIRTLDVSLVNAEMANNTSIDIAAERIEAEFKPKTLALTEDKLYATGDNDRINVYDRAQKRWGNSFKSMQGYTFEIPTRIYGMGNGVFWVSDTRKKELVEMISYRNEIHEYTRVSPTVVRANPNGLIHRQQSAELLIDLQTHEIISEE